MLKKFTVIELLETHSDSVANIKGNTIKFNNQTATELEYPPFVEFLVFPDEKQFAIRPCKECERNAVSFSKPKGERQYKVTVTNAVIARLIRKMTGWDTAESWNVPAIYEPEENALIYDLKAAVKPVSKGGGWAEKRRREAEAAKAAAMEDEE